MKSIRPSVDAYFMDMANLVASRSTCVRRSVGCVLVDSRRHVLATGYNGVAAGQPHCNDVGAGLSFPAACEASVAQSGTNLDGCQAVHAEQNAILQCHDVHAISRAYVTTFPCPSCAKLLLNTSCALIVYASSYGDDSGRRLWLSSGREAEAFDGPPRMIQADLVELFDRDELSAWRVLVACICLNVATARVARGVVFRVLNRWRTPAELAAAGVDLTDMLGSLGLAERRAGYLKAMSDQWRPGADPLSLPGVGRYAAQSVSVFADGTDLDPDEVGDAKVAAWVSWHRNHSVHPIKAVVES